LRTLSEGHHLLAIMTKLDLQPHSKTDLDTARTRGQVVGWIQGAGAVLVLGLVFRLVGWLPSLLLLGGGAFLLYKLFTKQNGR